MTSTNEIAQVFDRINMIERNLGQKIDSLRDTVSQRLTHVEVEQAKLDMACDDCRPKVMGNGREAIDARVARLEESHSIRRWVDRALLGGLFSILAVVVGWLPHWMKWW